MDYTIFCKDKDNVTTLTSAEIANPVDGLKALLGRYKQQQFTQRFENLFIAMLNRGNWRRFGAPVTFYHFYRDMSKLLDLLWLIDRCLYRNQYGNTVTKTTLTERRIAKQYKRRTFRALFINIPEADDVEEVVSPLWVIREFFRNKGLFLYKNDLWSYLLAALPISHMRNLDSEYLGIDDDEVISDYRNFLLIIDAAYAFLEEPSLAAPTVGPSLALYQVFAIDVDHPCRLEDMVLKKPLKELDTPGYYFDRALIADGLRLWFALCTRRSGHWDDHDDPGEVIFIKEIIEQQLEGAWMLQQTGYPRLNEKSLDPRYTSSLNPDEILDPLKAVDHFFGRHRLSEWKQLLETWLCQGLSDDDQSDTVVMEKDCEDVIKLMQALHLIEHRAID